MFNNKKKKKQKNKAVGINYAVFQNSSLNG